MRKELEKNMVRLREIKALPEDIIVEPGDTMMRRRYYIDTGDGVIQEVSWPRYWMWRVKQWFKNNPSRKEGE